MLVLCVPMYTSCYRMYTRCTDVRANGFFIIYTVNRLFPFFVLFLGIISFFCFVFRDFFSTFLFAFSHTKEKSITAITIHMVSWLCCAFWMFMCMCFINRMSPLTDIRGGFTSKGAPISLFKINYLCEIYERNVK